MIELVEKLLPLEVALGAGGVITYLNWKYDINTIYKQKIAPLISDAQNYGRETKRRAYEKGIKILEKSFTTSHTEAVERKTDYLKNMIKDLEA